MRNDSILVGRQPANLDSPGGQWKRHPSLAVEWAINTRTHYSLLRFDRQASVKLQIALWGCFKQARGPSQREWRGRVGHGFRVLATDL